MYLNSSYFIYYSFNGRKNRFLRCIRGKWLFRWNCCQNLRDRRWACSIFSQNIFMNTVNVFMVTNRLWRDEDAMSKWLWWRFHSRIKSTWKQAGHEKNVIFRIPFSLVLRNWYQSNVYYFVLLLKMVYWVIDT